MAFYAIAIIKFSKTALFETVILNRGVRVLIESDGEREYHNKEVRQFHEQASDILEAKERFVEEGEGASILCDAEGLSEEEVRAAAACAGEEVMIRNRFLEMNAPKDSSSVNKYYNLAHAVSETVIRQPSMLHVRTLRDYQLVMALIAYLMEFKGNYDPHLIIVPNVVLVNWKSEFYNWLPSVSCIFYVGSKDQWSKLFSQEVCAMKFNVLVNTYKFIMYDRSKLSKAPAFDRNTITGPAPTQNGEDDWLETEKKVIIIHRLHQILEPFMLRCCVEDVEGSLPPKVRLK
ncbi:hypothetical protein AHAS_Ahas12G0130800 [Arachis hypogaea]